MPGNQIFSWVIFKKTDGAADRHSIHVDIHGRHENRNLFSSSFQVFNLFGFFNYNNFAVSRSKNNVIIFSNVKNRISEKLKDGQVKNYARENGTIERQRTVGKEIIHG